MLNNDSNNMRILHFLNYNIKDLISEIPLIKEQGFDAIQISPVQPFKDEHKEDPKWYLVYQPLSFNIGNRYGSKEDLTNLCDVAQKFNIRIIVDVVCNHTANIDDVNPLIPNKSVDQILLNNPYFWKEKKSINDWNNRMQVTQYCMGLPGLNLANYDLQDIILAFLIELISCGVGGFRFDAAKSIALPYPFDKMDNYPDCHYWKRVIEDGLKDYDLFNYGEVIFASNELIKGYAKYTNVLTNRSVVEIPETISMGENHDSYLNEDEMGWSKNKSIDEVLEIYENLTKGWNKTVFFNRPNTKMWEMDVVRECNYQQPKSIEQVKIKTLK